MLRGLPAWIAIAFASFGALPVAAQQLDQPPSTSRVDLSGVCEESLARFCPALASGPAQPRNQVICLKPYRTSLSLKCRQAVTAALR